MEQAIIIVDHVPLSFSDEIVELLLSSHFERLKGDRCRMSRCGRSLQISGRSEVLILFEFQLFLSDSVFFVAEVILGRFLHSGFERTCSLSERVRDAARR